MHIGSPSLPLVAASPTFRLHPGDPDFQLLTDLPCVSGCGKLVTVEYLREGYGHPRRISYRQDEGAKLCERCDGASHIECQGEDEYCKFCAAANPLAPERPTSLHANPVALPFSFATTRTGLGPRTPRRSRAWFRCDRRYRVQRPGAATAEYRDGCNATFVADVSERLGVPAPQTVCRCGSHAARMVGKIAARYNPGRRCDFRCTTARSKQCSCACGGLNHGIDAA